MPSVINLIGIPAEPKLKTAEIQTVLTDNRFSVQIEGKTRTITSAVTEDLSVGERVIVADTNEGMFVVAKRGHRAREILEVVIDG